MWLAHYTHNNYGQVLFLSNPEIPTNSQWKLAALKVGTLLCISRLLFKIYAIDI